MLSNPVAKANTVQQHILDLLHRSMQERDMALLLISHDLGVVAQNADDLFVTESVILGQANFRQGGPYKQKPSCWPTSPA